MSASASPADANPASGFLHLEKGEKPPIMTSLDNQGDYTFGFLILVSMVAI